MTYESLNSWKCFGKLAIAGATAGEGVAAGLQASGRAVKLFELRTKYCSVVVSATEAGIAPACRQKQSGNLPGEIVIAGHASWW